MNLSFRLVFLFCSLALAFPALESLHSDHSLQHQTSSSSIFTRLCGDIWRRLWPDKKSSDNDVVEAITYSVPQNYQNRYGDDVVLRFQISTEEEARAFAEAVDILYLDIWESGENWVDLRISKAVLPSFLALLPASLQTEHKPLITDLPRVVYETYPTSRSHDDHRTLAFHRSSHLKTNGDLPHDLFFDNYQPLAVIYPWLRQIASMFPDRSELFTIGTSYEGRDIPALKIGIPLPANDPHAKEPRHTILIISGSHAREWVSISTATYILRSLIHAYDAGSDRGTIQKLLTHYDIIFVPVLNPDGYEYTWTTDRLWRKNRQSTTLPFCPGIDLDRAFPMAWDGDSNADNPCMESYAGAHPLQAAEAKTLADWALAEQNSTQGGRPKRLFTAFLDLHSYSQEILYPYSYTCNRVPHNLEDLEEVAIGLAKAFRLTAGHYYSVESACEGTATLTHQKKQSAKADSNAEKVHTRVEESGGSALDFFYQDLGIKYAFQIKLRDTGTYGFLLPKENIVPTGREAYQAVLGLGRWLLGNRGIEKYEANGESDGVWGEPAAQDKTSLVQESGKNESAEEEDPEWEYYYDEDEDTEVNDDGKSFELKRRRMRRRR